MLVDPHANERPFTAAFVMPLLEIILENVTRKEIFQRWYSMELLSAHQFNKPLGNRFEAKLMCAKNAESSASDDDERRLPGSNCDAVFDIYFLNMLEFCTIEVSGPPSDCEYYHYLEDRNKLGKNLKSILKEIISQNKNASPSCLKVYGIQFYSKTLSYRGCYALFQLTFNFRKCHLCIQFNHSTWPLCL